MSNRDVVDELQDALTQSSSRREGTDHSETNGDIVAVPRHVVEDAMKEIRFLRSTAGAVSTGESFKDIRKAAKGGDTISS